MLQLAINANNYAEAETIYVNGKNAWRNLATKVGRQGVSIDRRWSLNRLNRSRCNCARQGRGSNSISLSIFIRKQTPCASSRALVA